MLTSRLVLSRKITLLLAALGGVLLIITVIAFAQFRRLEGTYARLLDQDTRALLTIPRMNVILHDTARLAIQRVHVQSPEEAARVDQEFAAGRASMFRETAALRSAIPEFSRAATDIERPFEVLQAPGGRVRDASRRHDNEQLQLLMRREFGPRFDQLRVFLETLGDRIRQSMLISARETEMSTSRVVRRTLAIGVLALAAGLVAAQVWVWNSVARPLRGLVGAVRRLMAGDTHLEIPGGGRTDEIGLLASALGV